MLLVLIVIGKSLCIRLRCWYIYQHFIFRVLNVLVSILMYQTQITIKFSVLRLFLEKPGYQTPCLVQNQTRYELPINS